jgi:hypothetical protein
MIGGERSGLSTAKVFLEYKHPDGASVTHIRGTLLVNSVTNLKLVGLYDTYAALLAPTDRERITTAIAASWQPVEVASAHYAACDQLDRDDLNKRAGEMMATQLANTFLASAIRTSRAAGVQCMWSLLQQYGRLYNRLFRGGGVTLLQLGPKDVVVESHGFPMARSRYFATALLAYSQALATTFAGKAAYVRAVRPRTPHPHSTAMAFSWV